MARREAPAPEIANQTRRLLIMTATRWDSAEVAAAQEAIERFRRRRRQDPQVAARRAAAAAFRQQLGVPECPVVYWTPDPEHPVTKVCSKCGREKHLMEFYLDYQRGRRRPDCKACVRGRRRRHYQANGPRCREQSRQYKAAHSDRTREAQRAWRRRHPERHRHCWLRRLRRGAGGTASPGLQRPVSGGAAVPSVPSAAPLRRVAAERRRAGEVPGGVPSTGR